MHRPIHILPLLVAAAFITGCTSTSDERLLEGWNGFGDAHPVGRTTEVAELAEHPGEEVAIEGWVTEVCAVKGCWMRVRGDDDAVVLVRFRDYGFFVPRNARGRRTVVSGESRVTTFSVAQRRHLLEDAGASPEEIAAVTEPTTEVVLIADGVWIQGGGLEAPYAPPAPETCIIEEDPQEEAA